MIKEDGNATYMALIDNLPLPESTAASGAAAGGTDAESSVDGQPASEGPAIAWVRHFFAEEETEKGLKVCRCLLPPDPSSRTTQAHAALVTTDKKTLKNHLSSRHHERAMEEFEQKKKEGMADKAAAEACIASARQRLNKMRFSFKPGPGSDERLRAEIALLCWIAEKGISFAAIESGYFKAYHDAHNHQTPPGRARLSEAVLQTVYNLVMEQQLQLMRAVDFFSITADSGTSVGNVRCVALTVHFVHPVTFRLHACCIGVIPLQQSHTWVNLSIAIALRIAKVLPPYATLVATVTDSGANYLKLTASLHSNLEAAAIEGKPPLSAPFLLRVSSSHSSFFLPRASRRLLG